MKERFGPVLDNNNNNNNTPQAGPSPLWFSEEKRALGLRALFDDSRSASESSESTCHDRHLTWKLTVVEHSWQYDVSRCKVEQNWRSAGGRGGQLAWALGLRRWLGLDLFAGQGLRVDMINVIADCSAILSWGRALLRDLHPTSIQPRRRLSTRTSTIEAWWFSTVLDKPAPTCRG